MAGTKMPYEKTIRQEKIAEVAKGAAVRTGERLFGGDRQNVYAIPIEYLTYNPKNTRFLAEAKTFEADEGRSLDINSAADYAKIESYIWDFKKERNESTIESLLKDGQQKPGIVTKDGVVLSGNRRLRLINEIRRHPEKYQKKYPSRFEELSKFEAIVLDEGDLTPERMVSLETYYQFGEEDKVEYNPIQVYLSAHQQKYELKLDEASIASNFKVATSKVKIWLEVYDLMVEYLEHTGQQNRFIALTDLEDPFLNLNAALKRLDLERGGSSKVDWAYDDVDLEEMKIIYFDYLFARDMVGGKKYRDILKFFENESEWKALSSKQAEIQEPTESLKSVADYEKENPDLAPAKVIEKRRADFSKLNGEILTDGFRNANRVSFNNEVTAKPGQKIEELEALTSDTLDFVKRMIKWGKPIGDKNQLRIALTKAESDIREIKGLLDS